MNRHLFLGLSMLGALLLLGPVQAQTTDIGTDQIVNDTSIGTNNIDFTSPLTTFGTDAGGTGSGAGLLNLSGPFTKSLGTGSNQVQWTGSGGFVAGTNAEGGPAETVNIGVFSIPATLTWGQGGFVPKGSALLLSDVQFENNINLGTDPTTVAQINMTAPFIIFQGGR